MMSDGNPITVTAQADRNFVILLNAYKHLKVIKKIWSRFCEVHFCWALTFETEVANIILCRFVNHNGTEVTCEGKFQARKTVNAKCLIESIKFQQIKITSLHFHKIKSHLMTSLVIKDNRN